MANHFSIKSGSAYVRFIVKDAEFMRGLNKAKARLQGFDEQWALRFMEDEARRHVDDMNQIQRQGMIYAISTLFVLFVFYVSINLLV